MGFIEDIEKLELSDDDKQKLIASHRGEVDPLRETNQSLAAQNRKDAVEAEVVALSDLGFNEAPGLLKFYRRVLLSGDAEEPGAVLLSDTEMNLSGDEATGATGREEISVAGALREFVKLMPRNQEGKINLSDQGSAAEDHSRPDKGADDPSEKTAKARENLGKITGRSLTRTRSRYNRGAGTSSVEVTT